MNIVASGVAVALLALATAAPAAASGRTQLRQSVSRAELSMPKVGTVAGDTRIDFDVDLRLPHGQAAAKFADAVSTPGNALYHHFLSASKWEARFSPSPEAVAVVERFLRQQGFTVGKVPADRMVVPASGTAKQIEATFETSLSLHRVAGHVLRVSSANLSVPASLGATISGIDGITQVLATPDHTTGVANSTALATLDSIPAPPGYLNPPPCGSYYGDLTDSTLPAYGNGYPADPPWVVCGYVGPQLRGAYYGTSTPTYTGTGVTVAIVDAYASSTLESDAQTYAADNDPDYPAAGAAGGPSFSELLSSSFNDKGECGASSWSVEQSIDVESVHSMAPDANILYVGAQNCVDGLNAGIRQVVDGQLAQVITDSWGYDAGDLLLPASDRDATDALLEQAAGEGISVLFSSGDGGDEFTTVGRVSADYPPSSPYATAVGGTTLQINSSDARTGEYGWSTARSFLCNLAYVAARGCTIAQLHKWMPIDLSLDGGSGGGTSYDYLQPAWQAGVVPTTFSEANGSTNPMRVVPDISLEADPGTGVLVGETQTFANGTYYATDRYGGTSVASPLFAGLLATAIQEDGGTGFGLVNPDLYSLYDNSTYPTALNDIGPAGQQIESRSDYADEVDNAQGILYSTRIIDYEGTEQYCAPSGGCRERQVALHAVAGYDNMTGLGSPGTGLVGALAALATP